MKIIALSDLHGNLPEQLPACDLLLLAGDLCPLQSHDFAFQAGWLDTEFREWLYEQKARRIVGVAGNHDFVFERAPHLLPRDLPWRYLQDAGFNWNGVKIWGTPWQPWFWDWAFNGDPERLQRQWRLIPDETDILVVHGPPFGYGDGIPENLSPQPPSPDRRGGQGGSGSGVRHAGCPWLLERIQEIKPKLVVFGHIHEGRGEWQLGPTRLANVTLVDEAYEPVYPPWTCELELPSNVARPPQGC